MTETEALCARIDDAESGLAAVRSTLSALYAVLVKSSAKRLQKRGGVLALNQAGKFETMCGLMRLQEGMTLAAELPQAGKPLPEDLQRAAAVPPVRDRARYSERLMHDLTAHRTAALQTSLADSPHVALALVVHQLALPIFVSHANSGDGPRKTHAASTPGLGNR